MEPKVIHKDGPYEIIKHSGIPNNALSFWQEIQWGNEGAVYENMNTENHIHLITNPTLFAIHESGKIQGTALFSNTRVKVKEKNFNCNYIKYFASSKAIRGRGIMKKISKKVMELVSEEEKEKTIYFACIEKANRGSYRVVESAGYQNIGTIKTTGFSRFFPKKSDRIVKIDQEADKEKIGALLAEQYCTHALVQFDSIHLNDDFYAIKENDTIVAACQMHRAHWVVNKMQGWTGKLILKIVPMIPVINKIFNPQAFKFLAFEGIYVKEGHEKNLHALFEGLLAQEDLKSAIIWMGEECPIRKRIAKYGRLGLIHSFVKDSDVFVLASFKNMNSKEIGEVIASPLYASGFDYV